MRSIRLLFVVLFASCQFSSVGFAIEPDKAAHMGLSYGIALTSAQLCKKVLRLKTESTKDFSFEENLFCSLTGGVISFMGGMVKEANDSKPDPKDIEANLIGIGLAVGANLVFDF